MNIKVLPYDRLTQTVIIMGRRIPTRCNTMLYWTCNMLNMFRAWICPSSGARNYTANMACGV